MLWLENTVATSMNCITQLNCELVNIGKTHEGRDMIVTKVSTKYNVF